MFEMEFAYWPQSSFGNKKVPTTIPIILDGFSFKGAIYIDRIIDLR